MGVGIKISQVEKFQKINNRGGGGDYSEPERKIIKKAATQVSCSVLTIFTLCTQENICLGVSFE